MKRISLLFMWFFLYSLSFANASRLYHDGIYHSKVKQSKSTVYSGKRISLNFQNIKIRHVLQLIAEFTGFNLVTSDSVKGSITLSLKNLPWDQALDIILTSQGLTKRRIGNVILVAPTAEVIASEKKTLAAAQQIAGMAPLHTDLFSLKYASVKDIANILFSKPISILSKRGAISVNERSNVLLVRDTSRKLIDIQKLIRRLDVPIRQVLIKARIVNINTNYEHELGVRFGVTKRPLTGTLAGSNAMRQTNSGLMQTKQASINHRLNVDLPAAAVGVPGGAGSIGIALAKLAGGALLDLELSALEQEGGGEIIASPSLLTTNRRQAVIEQGVEIPYQQATSSGATVVAFKKAVLSLRVLPQVMSSGRLILTLQVNQDTVGERVADVPAINTRAVKTQVLMHNGETIVLGGIYEYVSLNEVERIPFLGTLPILGRLFKHQNKRLERRELLIFITPKIIT